MHVSSRREGGVEEESQQDRQPGQSQPAVETRVTAAAAGRELPGPAGRQAGAVALGGAAEGEHAAVPLPARHGRRGPPRQPRRHPTRHLHRVNSGS